MILKMSQYRAALQSLTTTLKTKLDSKDGGRGQSYPATLRLIGNCIVPITRRETVCSGTTRRFMRMYLNTSLNVPRLAERKFRHPKYQTLTRTPKKVFASQRLLDSSCGPCPHWNLRSNGTPLAADFAGRAQRDGATRLLPSCRRGSCGVREWGRLAHRVRYFEHLHTQVRAAGEEETGLGRACRALKVQP